MFKEVKQSIKNFFFFDKGEIILKVFLPDFNFKYDSEYELLKYKYFHYLILIIYNIILISYIISLFFYYNRY